MNGLLTTDQMMNATRCSLVVFGADHVIRQVEPTSRMEAMPGEDVSAVLGVSRATVELACARAESTGEPQAVPTARRSTHAWVGALSDGDEGGYALSMIAAAETTEGGVDQLAKVEMLSLAGLTAAAVAHDIATPLTQALALTSGLRQALDGGAPRDEMRELVGQITGALLYASDLTRELSRSASDEGSSEEKIVDVDRMLDEVVLLAAPQGSTPCRVVRRRGRVEPVLVAPLELKRALGNIVMNAVQAMQGMDDGVLEVRTRMSGRTVRIEISDTGPGVAEAVQSRIFAPYFTTKGAAGTGLGLFVSSVYVRRVGGELTMARAAGRTTFTVTVPTARSAIATPSVGPNA